MGQRTQFASCARVLGPTQQSRKEYAIFELYTAQNPPIEIVTNALNDRLELLSDTNVWAKVLK